MSKTFHPRKRAEPVRWVLVKTIGGVKHYWHAEAFSWTPLVGLATVMAHRRDFRGLRGRSRRNGERVEKSPDPLRTTHGKNGVPEMDAIKEES